MREERGILAHQLLGRDHEVELVEKILDEIHLRGSALVIHGEPRIRKSVLLADAVTRARERGWVSGTARPWLARLPRTGEADFKRRDRQREHPAERRGVDGHAAAARPGPAMIWVSRPPKQCPMTAGFSVTLRITAS
jgi:hypothetical protein